MQITVNGAARDLPDGTTVAELIEMLDLHGRPVAIERNQDVVPRATYADTTLLPGDRVEVVSFVGGG